MRAVLQRVTHASVEVEGKTVGSCDGGYLILLGVAPSDTKAEAERLWNKIKNLRVFDDEEGKMNLSLLDVKGDVLVVSQFTLFADSRRGNRPSFTDAARPDVAVPLYEYFCTLAEHDVETVGRGIFGAEMQVSLVNDGPITIWLDTDDLSRPKR
ncbi:MAG: D-tyrosyl-tRNA(Tyr) deacylase [Atopobiaceae bacterium]|nr:D-tyrosyl-tRNA(Tyr) deacylase [Atopobiaceae bacterium]